MGERFQLRLLGEFECRRGDNLVPIAGKKVRALLAYLALSPGRLHTREKLASLLWGDRFDKQARQSLRQAVVALRKELGTQPEDEIFFGDRERLGVVAGAIDVDVLRFSEAIADKTIGGARKSSEFYRGDLLADVSAESEEFEEWLIPERQRLRLLAIEAIEKLTRLEADIGHDDEALTAAQRLVDLDPLGESSHRLLAEVTARFRGPGPALRQLQAGIDVLQRELDAALSPETLRLAAALRQQTTQAIPAQSTPPALPTFNRTGKSRAFSRSTAAFAAIVAAAVAVVALIAGAGWVRFDEPLRATAPQEPGAPIAGVSAPRSTMSLIVLPFSDYGIAEARPIADALTEDLTTDLSLISGVFVIAHATSRAFRDRAVDPRELGRELGINHVLSGGVRLADGELRVNVALVDTRSGAQVWAQHFLGRERLKLEDDIVGSLLASLHVELTLLEAMVSARERPDSTLLGDLILRGRAARMRGPTPENVREALTAYKQAVELAPGYVWAAAGLAASHVIAVIQNQSSTPDADLERADGLIEGALAQNPLCFFCWHVKGMILHARARFAEAATAFERSIAINPNYPYANAQLALALLYAGRAQDAPAYTERAIKLSPRDPLVPLWLSTAAYAELLLGNDARAVEMLREAVRGNPRFPRLYQTFASALVLTGDHDGAREAMARFRSLSTGMSLGPVWAQVDLHPTFRAQRARIDVALRQAGLQ